MTRMTRKDWDAIAEALAFIATEDWDIAFGERPNFEAALEKVNKRREDNWCRMLANVFGKGGSDDPRSHQRRP